MSDSDSQEAVEAATKERRQHLKKQKSKAEKKAERKAQKKDGVEEETAEPIACRVIEDSEIGRFVDLGLGRGVDATKPSPWLSKSSFQVREVTFDNIIGTEEGGLVNNFEEVVESIQQLQTNMSASVPASQQVSVGVDSELSRSYSKTKKSVGTKVLTRTISFRADFDDICVRKRKRRGGKGHPAPQRAHTLPEGESATAEAQAALVRADSSEQEREPTFEERLSRWIIEHLNKRCLKALDELEKEGVVSEDANPIDKMLALTEMEKVLRKDLRPLCHDFVTATCITHYVCAIELGAAKYKVMSEEEVQTKLKTKGKIGVSSVADISVSQEAKWSRKNKEKHMTKIGIMEGGKVERGTTGEAVVGVKFQPLSSVVVRCNVLKKALEMALQRYIDNQGAAKYGPFYISCNSEQLFFKVDDSNKVAVTDNIGEASEFFVVPCEEDGGGRTHFSIFYNSKTKLNPHDDKHYVKVKPIPRYLCASVNYRGMSDSPLELKLNAKESKSMLVLHDRRSKHLHPVELTDWINGKEIFYINCKHRSFKKDSYITVKARHVSGGGGGAESPPRGGGQILEPIAEGIAEGEQDIVDNAASSVGTATRGAAKTVRYSTCCRPNISSHDDHMTFMLFRLIRVKQKDNWQEYEEQDKEHNDSEKHGGDRKASLQSQGSTGGGGGKGGGGGGGGGRGNKRKSLSSTEE